MEYKTVENWTSGSGNILVTKQEVKLEAGDQYIGEGLSGRNIFSWSKNQKKEYPQKKAIKVIARSFNLVWCFSGNNNISDLPVVDI